MVHAVVDVPGAVGSVEAGLTLARVVGEMVYASPAILTRAEFGGGTEGNFGLAKLPGEAPCALALIGADVVDAGGVVLAPVVDAVVGVDLASRALKSVGANTTRNRMICKRYTNIVTNGQTKL